MYVYIGLYTWICLRWLEKIQTIPEMVVKNGDESHGIESAKTLTLKKQKYSVYILIILSESKDSPTIWVCVFFLSCPKPHHWGGIQMLRG